MPTSTQPNGSPSDKPKKTRFEREIEEILEKAEKDNPLPPPTPIRPPTRQSTDDLLRRFRMTDVGGSVRKWLDKAPLLVAFLAAFVALMLRDLSQFLATIAATGSVVALFWPVVTNFRAPREEPKMWRGRSYDTATEQPPQPITRIQEWLRKKGILK